LPTTKKKPKKTKSYKKKSQPLIHPEPIFRAKVRSRFSSDSPSSSPPNHHHCDYESQQQQQQPILQRSKKMHECSFFGCGMKFPRKTLLQRHERTHTGERPFPCDRCGKRFARSDSLKCHLQLHSKPGSLSGLRGGSREFFVSLTVPKICALLN